MPAGEAGGEELKQAIRALAGELRNKIDGPQHGVGTFADHAAIGFIGQLEQLDPSLSWEDNVADLSGRIDALKTALQRIQLLVRRRSQGRFVAHEARFRGPGGVHGSSDIGYFDMVASQGVFDCLQWKGLPLFKTVYDFSLYPMLLWALKPATIFELGSGTGASAVWLADVTAMAGITGEVYSVDLVKPALQHDRVHFVEGNCQTIERVFELEFLSTAPHPWLLIEDVHVNVGGVLAHFHPYLRQGDYVIVEDSAEKQDEIRRFLAQAPGYKVDTYYTDFFGRNATCAQDSILVRTDD